MLKSYFLTGKTSHETTNGKQTSILFPRRIVKAIKEGSEKKLIRSVKAAEKQHEIEEKFKRRAEAEEIDMEKVQNNHDEGR